MHSLSSVLKAELESLAAADRLRACPEMGGMSRVRPTTAAGSLLSFCSNDYLGLASHPALAEAAAAAATRDGFGAGASRLVSGDLPAHRELEDRLAAFLGRAAVLVFPTGYQANVGAISALAGRDDLIASDAANHASLIDGCRLSRACVEVYRHADPDDAARALGRPGTFRRLFLLTESLFSMGGDAAPLVALAAAADRHDAVFMVDEAHALGVLGPGGRGLAAAAGISPDVLVGTLGKAFGAAGGFIAGALELRSYLVNRARTFIYTTASPPPVAAAAGAAVELAGGAEGDRRRRRLIASRDRLAGALGAAGVIESCPPGAIFPIVLGPDARALQAAAALRARGIFVTAIRPPTVPPGSARLRITISADHADDDIDTLAATLAEILR